MTDQDAVQAQNRIARVARIGPATEALRRGGVEGLKSHVETFYEYGTVADILLLCAAFDKAERPYKNESAERASLVKSLFSICAVSSAAF